MLAANPTLQADELLSLSHARFPNLSAAEKLLLRAAPQGDPAICGPDDDDKNPANDPAKAGNPPEAGGWGSNREIRAELIRWLCVNSEATKKIDPRGVWAYGAKITGELNLSSATVPFPLTLNRCRLTSDCNLQYVKIPLLDFYGTLTSSVNAEGADVRGDILFSDGFSAQGVVDVSGAQIGGNLDCSGATFRNPGGTALYADGADIKGEVLLRDGFSAEGEVNLMAARIASDLDCDGGTFKNSSGSALTADGAEIRGSVFFRNASAAGEVDLLGSRIGSNLECDHGTFSNPGGKVLNADGAEVRGGVFLRNGFSAAGEVNFFGARLRGELQALGWKNVQPSTKLDLRHATVGAIWDDEASWPAQGNLSLDGFVYGRIAGGPTDALARLRWLARQKGFAPQPYRQLAKVLGELGDDEGAKQVLFELEGRSRTEGRQKLIHSPARWLFRVTEDTISNATVGYGMYPGRAIWYLAALTGLGWILHRRAQRVGAMAPVEKEAYEEFHKNKGQAPHYHPPFNPLIYSLENCLPLVKFGQDDHWQPDPAPHLHPPAQTDRKTVLQRVRAATDRFLDKLVPNWAISPAVLHWFRWITIALGWLLATFFVAAVTGIVKTAE